jgi:hypothetical protein
MLPEVNCQQPMAQAQWVAQPRCCASAAPQQQVCRVQAYSTLMRPPPPMLLAWYIWCSYALVLHYHRFPADSEKVVFQQVYAWFDQKKLEFIFTVFLFWYTGFWHTGKPPPMIGLIIKIG